ncbi:MAG: pentapeptide repeat-containing protein [Acidiphilium sp.]
MNDRTKLERAKLDRTGLLSLLASRDPAIMLDLTAYDLSGGDFSNLDLSNLRIAGIATNGQPIQNADFRAARFHKVAFRDAILDQCDFRYAEFNETSFAGASLTDCDFYRAVFRRNVVFERTRLHHCSLHRADLSGCDVEWESLGDNAIVQADPIAYAKFLQRAATRIADPAERNGFLHRMAHYVAIAPVEAAGIYRKLSALLAANGLYRDSAEAYVAAKRMQRRSLRPDQVRHIARAEAVINKISPPSAAALRRKMIAALPTYLELLIADALCRFGTSVRQVLLSMLATIVGFALLYWATDAIAVLHSGSAHPATLSQCFAFSLGKMLASVPDGFAIGANFAILGQLETFISIGLIGLFGFVLGNYFRQT